MRQEDALSRAAVLRKLRLSDSVFRILTRSAAIAVLALLGGVIFALFAGAWPALQKFGFGFITTETWNPVTETFGGLAPIWFARCTLAGTPENQVDSFRYKSIGNIAGATP